jgi:hypothetical protein
MVDAGKVIDFFQKYEDKIVKDWAGRTLQDLREKLFKIKCLEKEGKVDAAKELEKELMDKIEEIENLLKIGKGGVKKFEKEYNDG